ncbi:MAG: nucleotide exchange factor GrpE [Christensenellaceae bacterium]|jgi:molecular chaperone GrpE|nr:nucleotide exchange factor GrpE [Christensenellaceae bacterium]
MEKESKNETKITTEELQVKLDEVILERDSAKKLAEDNLNLAKYQKAELENFRKHNSEAVSNAFRDGESYVVGIILPVYDGVVEAGKKIKDPADKEGFSIIERKLNDIFARLGIEEIKTVGEKFNPHLHNSASVEKVDGKEPGIVLEEWQKGFTFGGRVLRPATVKVSD